MKKVLVGLGVVIIFAIYALLESNQNSTAANITKSIPAAPFNKNDDDDEIKVQAPPVKTTTNSAPTITKYKDGVYTGPSVDAYYGNVQVRATIKSGKLTNIEFLDFPKDRQTSQRISQQATPLLAQEAIQSQSANVDIITGATQTSEGFIKSLTQALSKAL